MNRLFKILVVLYIFSSYAYGLILYGYAREASYLRPYEIRRLEVTALLAPILLPVAVAVMYGKDIAEKERESLGEVAKTCQLVFGFCGPGRKK